jgi:hypothetical protein
MKPTKNASELERLIHDRLYHLDEVHDDMRADPRLEPKVTGVRRHDRDSRGRNWNVTSMNEHASPYKALIEEIVEYLSSPLGAGCS